jgi:hypothetical protein
MAKIRVRELKDFTGGLNFRADQFQLADNESPDMLMLKLTLEVVFLVVVLCAVLIIRRYLALGFRNRCFRFMVLLHV